MKQLGGFQVLRPLQGPGLQTLNIEIITCTPGTSFSVILHTKPPCVADLRFLLLLVRDSFPSASQSQSLLLISIY